MRFRVVFCADNRDYAVNIADKALGLEALDTIRVEAGVPNLSARTVNPECKRLHEYQPFVDLPEDTARACGDVFRNDHVARVTVPPGALNRFCAPEYYQRTHTDTGEILEAGFMMALDESEVVEAWIRAGAPLVWAL